MIRLLCFMTRQSPIPTLPDTRFPYTTRFRSGLLGTRLAILAPIPQLGLIIVDEEHDTSYKQHDGLRYSARDLAVWRARDLDIPAVLGSATPSLESWKHAETAPYLRFTLAHRASASGPPQVPLTATPRLAPHPGSSHSGARR